MKLDSTVIGALIIGASILLSTIYYAKNTDYQTCVRDRHTLETNDPNDKRNKPGKLWSAHQRCLVMFRD